MTKENDELKKKSVHSFKYAHLLSEQPRRECKHQFPGIRSHRMVLRDYPMDPVCVSMYHGEQTTDAISRNVGMLCEEGQEGDVPGTMFGIPVGRRSLQRVFVLGEKEVTRSKAGSGLSCCCLCCQTQKRKQGLY